MKIFYVPIEPLEERYTASWYRNIPAFFRSNGADVAVIDGRPLAETVETGTFLDINSTVHYKCSQMEAIAVLFRKGEVKHGDFFFFGDIEFWGLEALRLLAQINQIKVHIVGVLHAGSYSIEDTFSVAAPYQKYTELGWLAACDLVFVGSEYHKQAVLERRITRYGAHGDAGKMDERIRVTGLPLFKADYQAYDVQKKDQVIISGRLDWEKRPNLSLDFAYLLYKKYGIKTVVTISSPGFRSNRKWLVDYARELEKDGVIELHSGLGKVEYHKLLAESKVMLSNTVEENFGYAVLEACYYGCCPVVPERFSLPEVLGFNRGLLFESEDEIIPAVLDILRHPYEVKQYAENYFLAMDRMWDIMARRM